MKLLILGGTVFLGRHLIEAALKQGHEVTCFHRGLHGLDFYPEVEHLQGDRRGDLSALKGRDWDAVVDTNGYVPSLVRASAQLLADRVKRYAFISSLSVYSDTSVIGLDESAPFEPLSAEQEREAEQLVPAGDGPIAQAYGELYGPLKARCEQVVEESMPGRALNIRAGLIVGPYDYSDRFTYWPSRIARGGEVLAPGRPSRFIQLIDARDIAEWMMGLLASEQHGIYNIVGPASTLSMQNLLETCQGVVKNEATLTWLDDTFLLEHGAIPWSQLPLWLPEDDESLRGFLAISAEKALATGLSCRPLAETVRDTLAWDALRSPDEPRRAGLEPEQEARLLQAWHQR